MSLRAKAYMHILLADDDPDDRQLTSDALQEIDASVRLDFAADGVVLLEQLRALRARQDLPDLVLLDLNMPRKSGMVALAELRSDPSLRHLPVVVLSTTRAAAEVLDCYRSGASAFLCKPGSYRELVGQMRGLVDFWQACALPRVH